MAGDDYGYTEDAVRFAAEAEAQLKAILDDLEDVIASPTGKVSTQARDALEHAGNIVEGDRQPLLEVIAMLGRPVDRGDATIYTARLVEAAFTIGVFASQFGSAKSLVRRLEEMSDAPRGKRPLGIRARVIAALRKLYPNGDPVAGGVLAEEVRRKVEEELGDPTSSRTLDRAREEAWLG